MTSVTDAQKKVLLECIDEPQRYNGRMARTIKLLESRGLVTSDYEIVLHSRSQFTNSSTERYTVRTTDKGKYVARCPQCGSADAERRHCVKCATLICLDCRSLSKRCNGCDAELREVVARRTNGKGLR